MIFSEKNNLTEENEEDVENEIGLIRQQCMQMGANDYENEAFDTIIKQYKENKISALEALKKAREILAAKQDYH